MSEVTLIVIAKAPVAGRCKTRLCPPFSLREAATLAGASLADTLGAVAHTPASRRVLVLDGFAGDWLPPGFDVIPQCSGGLDRRLEAAFQAVGGPALLVGMDTPQLEPALLSSASERLASDSIEAVLGPAADGGYWGIGLRRPCEGAFLGVPMSTPRTARAQRARLLELGLRVSELPVLRDVDTAVDAGVIAATHPQTRFAEAHRAIVAGWSAGARPGGQRVAGLALP